MLSPDVKSGALGAGILKINREIPSDQPSAWRVRRAAVLPSTNPLTPYLFSVCGVSEAPKSWGDFYVSKSSVARC